MQDRPTWRLGLSGTVGGRESGKPEAVVRQEGGDSWAVYLGMERVFRSSGSAGLRRAKEWSERFASRGWAGVEVVR
jgi:hypothetical protein